MPVDVIAMPEAPGKPSVMGKPANGVNAPEVEEYPCPIISDGELTSVYAKFPFG